LRSVTVVDVQNADALREKAPTLWAKLSVVDPFTQVVGDASEALFELRTEFSKRWMKKFFRRGQPLIEEAGKAYPADIEGEGWTGDDLYRLRQDAEGKSYAYAAQKKEPGPDTAQAALMHLLLKDAGAERNGSWYSTAGETVRIVQGAGESLASVKKRNVAAPAAPRPTITICAGAEDVAAPANIVAAGERNSIIRPNPSETTAWLTVAQARERLAI
jgi:hypothetical protein